MTEFESINDENIKPSPNTSPIPPSSSPKASSHPPTKAPAPAPAPAPVKLSTFSSKKAGYEILNRYKQIVKSNKLNSTSSSSSSSLTNKGNTTTTTATTSISESPYVFNPNNILNGVTPQPRTQQQTNKSTSNNTTIGLGLELDLEEYDDDYDLLVTPARVYKREEGDVVYVDDLIGGVVGDGSESVINKIEEENVSMNDNDGIGNDDNDNDNDNGSVYSSNAPSMNLSLNDNDDITPTSSPTKLEIGRGLDNTPNAFTPPPSRLHLPLAGGTDMKFNSPNNKIQDTSSNNHTSLSSSIHDTTNTPNNAGADADTDGNKDEERGYEIYTPQTPNTTFRFNSLELASEELSDVEVNVLNLKVLLGDRDKEVERLTVLLKLDGSRGHRGVKSGNGNGNINGNDEYTTTTKSLNKTTHEVITSITTGTESVIQIPERMKRDSIIVELSNRVVELDRFIRLMDTKMDSNLEINVDDGVGVVGGASKSSASKTSFSSVDNKSKVEIEQLTQQCTRKDNELKELTRTHDSAVNELQMKLLEMEVVHSTATATAAINDNHTNEDGEEKETRLKTKDKLTLAKKTLLFKDKEIASLRSSNANKDRIVNDLKSSNDEMKGECAVLNRKAVDKDDAIKRLSLDIQDITTRVNERDNAIEELKSTNTELINKSQVLENEVINKYTKIDRLNLEIERVKSVVSDKDEIVTSLKADIDRLESISGSFDKDMNGDLHELRVNITTLNNEISVFQDEVLDKNIVINTLNVQVEEFARITEEKGNDIRELRSSNDTLTSECFTFQNEITVKNETIERMSANDESNDHDHDHEVSTLKATIKQKVSDLDMQGCHVDDLTSTIQRLKGDNAECNKRADERLVAIGSLQDELNNEREFVERLNCEVYEFKSVVNERNEEIGSLNSTIDVGIDNLEALQDEVNKEHEVAECLKDEIDDFKSVVQRKDEEVSKLTQTVCDHESVIQGLKDTLDKITSINDNDNDNDDNDSRGSEECNLSLELTSSTTIATSLSDKVNALQNLNIELKAKVKAMSDNEVSRTYELSSTINENVKLTQIIDDVYHELDNSTTQVTQLTSTNVDLNKLNTNLKTQMSTLHTTLTSKLNNTYTQHTLALTSLTSQLDIEVKNRKQAQAEVRVLTANDERRGESIIHNTTYTLAQNLEMRNVMGEHEGEVRRAREGFEDVIEKLKVEICSLKDGRDIYMAGNEAVLSYEQLSANVKDLELKLKTMASHNDISQTQHDEVNVVNSQLQKLVVKAADDSAVLNITLFNVRSELEKVTLKCEELEVRFEEVGGLNSAGNDCSGGNEDVKIVKELEFNLKEAKRIIYELRQQITTSTLRNTNEITAMEVKFKTSINDLFNNIQELNEKLKTKDIEIHEATSNLALIKLENEEFRNSIVNLHECKSVNGDDALMLALSGEITRCSEVHFERLSKLLRTNTNTNTNMNTNDTQTAIITTVKLAKDIEHLLETNKKLEQNLITTTGRLAASLKLSSAHGACAAISQTELISVKSELKKCEERYDGVLCEVGGFKRRIEGLEDGRDYANDCYEVEKGKVGDCNGVIWELQGKVKMVKEEIQTVGDLNAELNAQIATLTANDMKQIEVGTKVKDDLENARRKLIENDYTISQLQFELDTLENNNTPESKAESRDEDEGDIEEVIAIKLKLKEANKELTELHCKVEEKDIKLKNVTSEVTILKSTLYTTNGERVSLLNKLNDETAELEGLRNEVVRCMTAVDDGNLKCDNLEFNHNEKVEVLNSNIAELHDKVEINSVERSELMSKLEQITKTSKMKSLELTENQTQSKQSLETITNLLTIAQGKLNVNDETITQLTYELETNDNKVTRLKSDNDLIIVNADENMKDLKSEHDDSMETVKKRCEKLEGLLGTRNISMLKNYSNERTVEELKVSLIKSEEMYDGAKKMIGGVKSRLDEAVLALSNANEALRLSEERCEDRDGKVNECEDEIYELKGTVNELKQIIVEMNEQIEDTDIDAQVRIDDLTRDVELIEHLQSKVTTLTNEVQMLNEINENNAKKMTSLASQKMLDARISTPFKLMSPGGVMKFGVEMKRNLMDCIEGVDGTPSSLSSSNNNTATDDATEDSPEYSGGYGNRRMDESPIARMRQYNAHTHTRTRSHSHTTKSHSDSSTNTNPMTSDSGTNPMTPSARSISIPNLNNINTYSTSKDDVLATNNETIKTLENDLILMTITAEKWQSAAESFQNALDCLISSRSLHSSNLSSDRDDRDVMIGMYERDKHSVSVELEEAFEVARGYKRSVDVLEGELQDAIVNEGILKEKLDVAEGTVKDAKFEEERLHDHLAVAREEVKSAKIKEGRLRDNLDCLGKTCAALSVSVDCERGLKEHAQDTLNTVESRLRDALVERNTQKTELDSLNEVNIENSRLAKEVQHVNAMEKALKAELYNRDVEVQGLRKKVKVLEGVVSQQEKEEKLALDKEISAQERRRGENAGGGDCEGGSGSGGRPSSVRSAKSEVKRQGVFNRDVKSSPPVRANHSYKKPPQWPTHAGATAASLSSSASRWLDIKPRNGGDREYQENVTRIKRVERGVLGLERKIS